MCLITLEKKSKRLTNSDSRDEIMLGAYKFEQSKNRNKRKHTHKNYEALAQKKNGRKHPNVTELNATPQ